MPVTDDKACEEVFFRIARFFHVAPAPPETLLPPVDNS